MSIFEEIAQCIISGNAKRVKELTEQGLAENISPKEILDQGLIGGMSVIGARFKNGECFVPEVLIAAKAMHAGMDLLKPRMAARGDKYVGKVLIGTVRGDMHDIGKNLVGMMLEGAGFEVVDLGVDVPAAKFVEKVQQENPQILCLSALLTTTMNQMKDVLKALNDAGVRNQVKVMIGGAPVTDNFCKLIGADGYSADAASATALAKELVA